MSCIQLSSQKSTIRDHDYPNDFCICEPGSTCPESLIFFGEPEIYDIKRKIFEIYSYSINEQHLIEKRFGTNEYVELQDSSIIKKGLYGTVQDLILIRQKENIKSEQLKKLESILYFHSQKNTYQIFLKCLSNRSVVMNVKKDWPLNYLMFIISLKIKLQCSSLKIYHRGKILPFYHDNNTSTLADYKIEREDTLEVAVRQRGGGAKLFNFASMEAVERRALIDSAPDWRTVVEGLNVEGTCRNKRCNARGRKVWTNWGVGSFSIATIVHTAVCPQCNGDLENVDNCGFVGCIYSYVGKYEDEAGQFFKVEKDNLRAEPGEIETFENTGEDCRTWCYLDITTRKLNTPSTEGVFCSWM